MSLVDHISFTYLGVTCLVITPTSGVLVVPDWLPDPQQQERHIGGTNRVQVPTFGNIWRWQGEIYVETSTDFGTLRTAFLAQPRTTGTWSDGVRSIPNVVFTRFEILQLIASGEGYVGPVAFVATEGV